MLRWFTFKELAEISGLPEEQLRKFASSAITDKRKRLITKEIGNAERTTNEEFERFSREILYGGQNAKYINSFRMKSAPESEFLKNIKETL